MDATVGANGAIDFTSVMMADHQTVSNSRQCLAESLAMGNDFCGIADNNKTPSGASKIWVLCNKAFGRKNLKRHIPIFQWLPVYNREDFVGDLIAGITVSLAAIPLALAFAGIAGLPTEVKTSDTYHTLLSISGNLVIDWLIWRKLS